MKNVKNIAIDGERLAAALRLNGVTLKEASVRMGRSEGFLSNAVKVGYINPSTEKLIEALFNIPLGMYIPTFPEEVPEETPAENVQVNIDYEYLQEAIYSAIMGAVRKLQREGVIPGGEA